MLLVKNLAESKERALLDKLHVFQSRNFASSYCCISLLIIKICRHLQKLPCLRLYQDLQRLSSPFAICLCKCELVFRKSQEERRISKAPVMFSPI